MIVCGNCGAANEEGHATCVKCGNPLGGPVNGLAALRRLSALGPTASEPLRQDKPTPTGELSEAIPDWLELLLAKYGQEAPTLAGLEPRTFSFPEPSPPSSSPPETASELAHLLEQMGTQAPSVPEREVTSVDWGKPAPGETVGEETDWLDSLISKPLPSEQAPAEPPAAKAAGVTSPIEKPASTDETPDWLKELGFPAQPAEPAPQPEPSVSEEVPDWLSELDMAASRPETPTTQKTPAATDITDWLTGLEEAEAPPTATQPAALEEGAEIPDWLRDQGEVFAPGAPPPPPTPAAPPSAAPGVEAEGKMPDWLARLAKSPAETAAEGGGVLPFEEEKPVVSEAGPAAETGVPSWLADLGLPEAETAGPAEGEAAPEAVPDWLRDMGLAEPAPPPPPEKPPAMAAAEAPAGPEPELPDWLASLRSEDYLGSESLGLPSPEEAAEEAPEETAEEPDWLAQLRAAREAEARELGAEVEVVEAEQEELPDWLAELGASQEAALPPSAEIEFIPQPPQAEPEKPQAYPEAAERAEPEEAGALDWLAELETVERAEPQAPSVPTEQAGLELPDWLLREEASAFPTPAQPPTPEKAAELPGTLSWLTGAEPEGPEGREAPSTAETAPVEMPDWLRELQPEEKAPAQPREAEGVLAGMPGLLPVVEEPKPPAAPPPRAALPEVPDVAGARLFREIGVGRPAQAAPSGEEAVPESRRGRILKTLIWAVVFIVLIVAIALALMTVLSRVGELMKGAAFGEFFGSPLAIDQSPVSPINTLRAEIIKLPSDAVVVVSFDYSPATEAEMDPLAEVIVRDLLSRQARVVIVSLQPEGAAMAHRLLGRVGGDYAEGQRILNLGYLPGQTIGVRNLAFMSAAPLFQVGRKTMRDYQTWQDVSGLGDVALIVDVADNPLAVRWWVEQAGPGTQANRPLIAAVSAAADPTVRPYYNALNPKAGQLRGLVSGVTGAAAYENRLQQPGRAMGSLAAQSVANLSLVVFSLGGTIVGLAHRTRGM